MEPLEDRCLLSAAISITDASAIEGATAVKLLDRFIAAGSGGLSRPRSLIFGPDANSDGVQDLYVTDLNLNAVLRYDGFTGAFIDVFVASGSGGLNNPGDLVFGPNGNLYVSSYLGNQVLEYSGSSGAFLGVVASGLSLPLGLTFGTDGSLYIANQGTNEVLRNNNAGLSAFVSAGSGGLSQPRNAVFGQDGNLYVASQDTHQVLRYNGLTGVFIDAFTSPVSGQGGLLWMEFGTDGYLYTTARTATTGLNTSLNRFNATTGTYVDTLSIGRDSWSFMVGPNNIIYYSGNGGANYIERYGHSSLVAFSVSLSSASAAPVTVSYTTANGTAEAGSDYVGTSGTLTFAPGQTTRTVLVLTLNDAVGEGTETSFLTLSNPVGGVIVDGEATATITDDDATKFFVVNDGSPDQTYRYGTLGNAQGNSTLGSGNSAPRGAASNAAGTTVWVVDANKKVYVYTPSGALLGSWTAGSLASNAQVEGIATNGTDIWIVDAKQDKVFRYTGAASRLSGSQSAASSFNLNSSNSSPKDLVTDGTYLWVVNDSLFTDKVFKYTLSGALVGSWTISGGGGSPTGITLDPSNVSHLWIVDSGTDRVYQYDNATSRTSGSQAASTSFALAAGNTNPQGIADPPAPAPSGAALSPNGPMGRLPDQAWNDALAWGGNLNLAAWDAPPLGTLRGDWWLGRAEEEGHGPGDGPPNRGATEESPAAGTGHSLAADAGTEDAALRDQVFAGDQLLSGPGLLGEADLVEALLLPEMEGVQGKAWTF